MNATPSPRTLIEARADYRMCIEERFLDPSPLAWRAFLVSYLAQERARAIQRDVRRANAVELRRSASFDKGLPQFAGTAALRA